ncbi:MAG: hypothetical protein H0X28_01450 [Solirubrobacterales bacterium]|nr:hypothetical protein [Solirubrobacterales bacterium]
MRSTLKAGKALVAAVLALGATATSAGAAQTSFGADLRAHADDPAVCGEGFFPTFLASPSCTWLSGGPGVSFYAPASGTVTAVRVRAGALGGQMQVLVMRSLYENKAGDPEHPYFTCCFVEAYGPVFEAKAGAVTTVTSSLAMTEQPTPPLSDVTTKAAGDLLAISILSPNVPIPALIDEKSRDAGFYPAPTPSTQAAPGPAPLSASASPEGAEMLMNADFETRLEAGVPSGAGGSAPSGGGGAPAGEALNPIALARRPSAAVAFTKVSILVRRGVAAIALQCLALDCAGSLSLQSVRTGGAARTAKKRPQPVSYGTARFSLKAGAVGNVRVKLNAAARRTLKRRHRLVVRASVRFTSGGVAPISVPITLKK